MKKAHMRFASIALALAITTPTVFGCTTGPCPNLATTKSEQGQKPEAKPAPDAQPTSAETKPAEVKPAPKKDQSSAETKPTEAKSAPTCKETKPAAKPAEQKEEAKPAEGEKQPFVIDNFKIISAALEKLGVTSDELEVMIKEGKKLPEVLEAKEISVKCFKKALIKEYNAVIKEAAAKEQISKDEAKVLRKAIKEKVMSWLKDKE